MPRYRVQYKDPDRYVENIETGEDFPGDIPDDVRTLAPEYLVIEVDTDANTATVVQTAKKKN